VWLEATAEKRQLCAVIESKRGSELVELHCVFQTDGSQLEAFELRFSLNLRKLSKTAKEGAKLPDKAIVVVIVAGVLCEVGAGLGVAWVVSKVRDEVANACPVCGKRLWLHLELHGIAEQEIAKVLGGVLELRRGTKNNTSVNLIVVAIATTVTFVIIVLVLERWGFNRRLGAAFGGG
jgi:hypothetical protein